MKKGGKLHIGGNSKPLFALTDLKGVDGFVPFPWATAWALALGLGLYVTGREDEAVGDWV